MYLQSRGDTKMSPTIPKIKHSLHPSQKFNTNTVAKAKLVKNKKLGTFKLVVEFNVTQQNSLTDNYIFPPQNKCAYVSGDIFDKEISATLKAARKALRTENIFLVE